MKKWRSSVARFWRRQAKTDHIERLLDAGKTVREIRAELNLPEWYISARLDDIRLAREDYELM